MGGSSSSKQEAEGDINFNNVDYGQGGGSSPLKNLNIGRENNLSGASFNVEVTDGKAFTVAGKALDNNAWLAGSAIDANRRVTSDALNTNRRISSESMDLAGKVTGNALDFGESTLSKAISFISSANKQSNEAVQTTTEQFTNKFSEFANRQSSSSDQRVQDLAKWGIGAMVAVTAWNTWNARKR